MKLTRTMQIDLSAIDKQLGNSMDAESAELAITQIMAGFVRFVNDNKAMKQDLISILQKRLKVSTFNLAKSMSIKAFETQQRELNGGSFVPVNLYLMLDTEDETLINALYGEKEQVPAGLPSIDELSEWIRGKRRFFDKQINDLSKRQAVYRNTLREQRARLGGKGKLNLPEKKNGITDPVKNIASIIRSRMSERLDKGSVSPTKGSRFIFLGNHPEYSGDKSKWSFKPKYREEEKALLVKKKPNMNAKNPVTGVLNDYISKIAFDYYTKIIADYVSNGMYKSVNSPQYDAPAKEKKFKTRGKNKGQEKNVDTEDLRYMRQFASIAKSRNQHRIEQLINSVVRLSAKMKKLKHLDKVTATRETKQIFNDSKKVIYDYALGDGNDLKKSIADEIAAIKAQMSAKKYILDMKELKRIKRRPVIRRKKRGK